MAPEMLQGNGYSFEVDWWSVGVVTYEMLAGHRPFEFDANKRDLQTLYTKIVCDTIDIPTWLSPDVADLVWNLLDKKPHCRLGALDIKWHPFFDGLKWSDVMAKKYQMPRPPPRRPVGSITSSQTRDSIFNQSEDNYEVCTYVAPVLIPH
ncbi:RAC family serine/threonine-protein kinase homolog [Zootermopsis nevadensis]|uniref:RAC family serine/threonine-protein kinase-like protein n=1 Tax=Zootermopsis nevadensis TaxID=136037 RepID=A0A067QRU9_ZOONE|nr:RAC family serine/threonine-protein kinase homolog [Zootermopsis nevadensis]XP_021941972.1 RAC family serine/threonine-protein kinase homolog [Zootermopsis nevadensis]KDQ71580.1 RAC family serine/threonine-protein kinase-like protein [Zootermopsis nevadensis]